jgi:hypothetical protein
VAHAAATIADRTDAHARLAVTLTGQKQAVVMRHIHDERRTARMNCIYYEKRLKQLQHWNLAVEILIALATSSGVAGLAFWKSDPGRIVWGGIAALAAIASAVKPLLGLSKRIEAAAELRQGYLQNFLAFNRLAMQIEGDGEVTAGHVAQHDRLADQVEALAKQDEINPRLRLLEAAQLQVAVEMPIETLWMPPAGRPDAAAT